MSQDNRTTLVGRLAFFVALTVALTLPTGPARAATIDVFPGQSIEAAARSANHGDTIRVKPGVYEEVVTLNDGESNLRIVAVPAHGAITRGFRLRDCDSITVEGFVVEPASPGGNVQIYTDSDNHRILYNIVRNTQMEAIMLEWRKNDDDTYKCNNVIIRGNRLIKVRFGMQLSGHDLLVEDNEVNQLYNWDWHQGGDGRDDCDYLRGGGTDNIIRNNWFHGTPPNLPDDPNTGPAHVDGFQSWNYDGGTGYTYGMVLEGNVFDGAHQGMLLQNRTTRRAYRDIVIRNNVYMNCTTWMLSLGGAENIQVYNNVFYNADTMGVVFHDDSGNAEFSSSGILSNNIFHTMGGPYWGDPNHVSGGNNVTWNASDGNECADSVAIDPQFFNPGTGGTLAEVRESFRPHNPIVVNMNAGLDFNGTLPPVGMGSGCYAGTIGGRSTLPPAAFIAYAILVMLAAWAPRRRRERSSPAALSQA